MHALDGGRFILTCEGGDAAEVKAALCRYIVADRVTVKDVSSEYVLIHATEAASLRSDALTGALAVHVRRISDEGQDVLLPQAGFDAWRPSVAAPLTTTEFNVARTLYGGVSFPEEVNADIILTEAGLKELVSFSKGCYVGQEVIERSDAIGKLPRKIERARFKGQAAPSSGAVVRNSEGEAIGKVSSAFLDNAEGEAFAFVLLRTGKYAAGEQILVDDIRGELF